MFGRSYLILFLIGLLPLQLIAEEKKIELPLMHHLVDIKPPEEMKVADYLPLSDEGKIICKTCHGIKDIDKTEIDRVDKKADDFHRGGPYEKLSDFCYLCHDKNDYQRPNIHNLLDEDGKYDEKDCEYCHKEAPDPEKKIKRDELEFRLPPENLCWGCHLDAPHFNALNHRIEPSREMRKRIAASEKKHRIILPLDSENKVMCVTCHSPHEPGVIAEDKPAGRQVADVSVEKGVQYEDHGWNKVFRADKEKRLKKLAAQGGGAHQLKYQRLQDEVLLRLSAKDGTLCLACHEFER
ncbi:MAG: hypothetical protein OQK32_04280 [Gammaproteobacteria bacterium]|nr:hypothetical protein [Gammaproteobacteria bacterium]MCW8923030.1 hypothetical protein [Gammaproteobacteria bacterium]